MSVADKAPSEAVFRGTEFLSYDLSQTGGEPIVSAQDTITLYFKTRQPNGLLFYTGDKADGDGTGIIMSELMSLAGFMLIFPQSLSALCNLCAVEFVADTLRLNLLELGRAGNHLIQVVGRLEYKCPTGETHDPISFTTRESHL
ncbi:hypothetical protein YQE_03548, partial [Dendroctonus ponderosae]